MIGLCTVPGLFVNTDHPYGFGTLYGSDFNAETKSRERFVIAETRDLLPDAIYRLDASRRAFWNSSRNFETTARRKAANSSSLRNIRNMLQILQ
jgi:hypothetical protein